MTVRIGNTESAGRRRGHDDRDIGDGSDIRRRTVLAPQSRKHRSAWWYHLDFALLKSRA
jgi:hypothetical protein